MSSLAKFLKDVAKDPTQFKADPDAAMAVAQLTPAEIALIKSANASRIKEALAAESGSSSTEAFKISLTITIEI